jgi:universal stress protein A
MLPVKKILCPIDFSNSSLEALRVSSELARHFSSELTVIHVVQPVPVLAAGQVEPGAFCVPSYQQEMEVASMKLLQKHIDNLAVEGLTARPVVVLGDPADMIVQIAEDEKADLIVIATRGQSGIKRLIIGSVTEKVVRHAVTPVLTIKGSIKKD